MARRSNPAERLQNALAGLLGEVVAADANVAELDRLAAALERNNDDDIASGNVWPEPLGLDDVDHEPADADL